MKFAILHLSDIHFRPFHQFVLQRVKGIAAALMFPAPLDWENLLIVLSGDIAYLREDLPSNSIACAPP